MESPLQFEVAGEGGGERLDVFLASRLGWLSRMRIAGLLAGGACTVNSEAARAGLHLSPGDR
ncbi:MAG TPA: hypothetical protein VF723_03120, partial [Pyrinomonadaceae bacterium]